MLNEVEIFILCVLVFVSRVFIYVVVLYGINGWLEFDMIVYCFVV